MGLLGAIGGIVGNMIAPGVGGAIGGALGSAVDGGGKSGGGVGDLLGGVMGGGGGFNRMGLATQMLGSLFGGGNAGANKNPMMSFAGQIMNLMMQQILGGDPQQVSAPNVGGPAQSSVSLRG